MFLSTFTIFCILETLLLTHAFLNKKSLKIFQRPDNLKDDSLYGFSIAYQSKNSRLLVSAPQGSHAGQIYYIDVKTGKINKEPWEAHFRKTFGVKDDQIKYNWMLGATVTAGPDFYVTCIPRYVEMKPTSRTSTTKVPATLSICFIKQNDTHDLEPIAEEDRFHNTKVFRDRLDSFGWSIHVVSNQKDILIGGAAMNKGRVSLYNALKKHSKPKLINQISADNPVKYNFGYSVSSGQFFSNQTVYAISTTFGDKGYGKVYFFNTNLDNIGAIKADHVGSMYGAALCSAMLRGAALLVGAPTYAENQYSHDVGAVYIYAAQSIGSNSMAEKIVLKGSKSGGFFGHSIVSLGDLDDDGNDEIAIAAPYEDNGKGAVYIYSGVGILEGKIRKRIQPEGLYSFGFSLATLQKQNECNGLAVGAIGTNSSVAVLNGMASITVKLNGSIDNVKNIKNDKKRKELEITSCISVDYPKKPVKIKADLEITVKISNSELCTLLKGEDKLTYVQNIIERKSKLCQNNIKAICINNEYSNLVISYEITATLKEDPENTTEYDPSSVLLSERSSLFYEANEYSSCGGKICKPMLKLHISSTFAKPYYIVGSSTSEYVSVNVSNTGDTAYGACVELRILGALVSRYPTECTVLAGTDTILCKNKHSISKDQQWIIGNIKLEPRQDITSTDEYYVELKSALYNDCNKPDQVDDEVTETYDIKGDTDNIHITGQTNPEGDVDVTPTGLRTERKSFEHLYIIENKGITNWNGMQVQIILPNASYIGYPEVPIKIYTVTSYLECAIDNRTQVDDGIVTTCNIGDLLRSDKTSLTISMEIVPNTLELDEIKPNVTVTTTLKLLNTSKFLSKESLVKLQVASVPTWVIATASVIGLLLFGLVVFALYEFGFLKRKNKDKLVALKKEVYRQSVRRSHIRDSMRAAAKRKSTEDIQFLTDAEDNIQEREMTIDEQLQQRYK
ncbi:integrin alpha-4-like [Maniola jurtina]|uniref:integrin alpha-4-like n=1 Tax=Maniola jurtina TaxID=191418 RepID=UPI001E687B10|nr:integrin alpha-4-like [Maniola jurtina]